MLSKKTMLILVMISFVGFANSFVSVSIQNPLFLSSLAAVSNNYDTQQQQQTVPTTPSSPMTTERVFFDIQADEEPLGRLIFQVPVPNYLPKHTENILNLIKKSRVGLDSRCSYIGCDFQFSPQFIQGFAQYRWSHSLKGKGRNAIRQSPRGGSPVKEAEGTLQQCCHAIYGGTYYGLSMDQVEKENNNNNAQEMASSDENELVLLTVPLSGPGRGSTSLSIVRVTESPPEWKERLLLNSAVIGWMETSSSLDTLRRMAQQTVAPPKVVNSGQL